VMDPHAHLLAVCAVFEQPALTRWISDRRERIVGYQGRRRFGSPRLRR
jgi:hypothetical protein